MANGTTNAGLMDNNVPSQLDMEDLSAELELSIPDSGNDVMAMIQAEDVGEIEITSEDDGGVLIDFDPMDQRGQNLEFDANLAEEMPERELSRISSELLGEFDANKASRQDWEEAYSSGLELLGFNYEERTQPFRGASGVTHPLLAEAAYCICGKGALLRQERRAWEIDKCTLGNRQMHFGHDQSAFVIFQKYICHDQMHFGNLTNAL